MSGFSDFYRGGAKWRLLLILISVILVTWWFPRYSTNSFDYQEGTMWRYDDLESPMSFGIPKTEEELTQEQEQLAKSIPPVYIYNPSATDAMLSRFAESYGKRYRQFVQNRSFPLFVDSARMLERASNSLRNFGESGIVELLPEHRAASTIQFHRPGVEPRPMATDRLPNVKRARSLLRDSLNGVWSNIDVGFGSFVTSHLSATVEFDSLTTNSIIRRAIADISQNKLAVAEGEIIIRKNELVTPAKAEILREYQARLKTMGGKRSPILVYIGTFLLTGLLFAIYTVFLRMFAQRVFLSTRTLLFTLVLIVSFILITCWAVRAEIWSYYVIPYCIIPIILRTFYGTRLALYTFLLVVLLCSFIVPPGVEFTTLHILAGMVAIFTNIKAHYWSQFFISIGFILLTYSIGFLAIAFIEQGSLTLDYQDFGWLTINVFLTLLAYPLIHIFEKLFGVVSELTLMEYGDLNKKLLRKLSVEAPGTFQHSLQVANLSEAAATAIGANSMLVKVGALYHDIGKLERPSYFIENQNTAKNPHDDLPFEKSAEVIIAHVTKGVEMARKAKLPDLLVDFIATHHGTMRVEYFYRSFVKNFPEADIDDAKFRYPGPLPTTKEQAILMMADGVEAASRSQKEPTQETLDKLVEGIIDNKMKNGQFEKADITFKEIRKIKQVFKKMLHSIYHVRIEYPPEQ